MTQIRLKKTELLEQKVKLAERDNNHLREQLIAARALIAEQESGEAECPECDEKELARRRDYLEHRILKESKAAAHLNADGLAYKFRCAGKSVLLCHLQDLQHWKLKLAEAELAAVVQEQWRCKTLNSEDYLGCLMDKIQCQIDACPDQMDPYVADAINDTV
jgi:hypothetical protein